jgi:hypothetical protein
VRGRCVRSNERGFGLVRTLLLNRVKVEIFLVVVVVVGGRVDKRTKSAWLLAGRWVHGFQNRIGRDTGDWKRGPSEGVWGGVFQPTHRRVPAGAGKAGRCVGSVAKTAWMARCEGVGFSTGGRRSEEMPAGIRGGVQEEV